MDEPPEALLTTEAEGDCGGADAAAAASARARAAATDAAVAASSAALALRMCSTTAAFISPSTRALSLAAHPRTSLCSTLPTVTSAIALLLLTSGTELLLLLYTYPSSMSWAHQLTRAAFSRAIRAASAARTAGGSAAAAAFFSMASCSHASLVAFTM